MLKYLFIAISNFSETSREWKSSLIDMITIELRTGNSVLYPEVISTIEYVTIVLSTDNKVDWSIRKNPHPEKVS